MMENKLSTYLFCVSSDHFTNALSDNDITNWLGFFIRYNYLQGFQCEYFIRV